MQALAKRVEDRYQSAAQMRADIERYLAGRPVQAPAVAATTTAPVVPPTPPVEATSVVPMSEAPYDEGRGGRRAAWVVALLVLLGLLVASAVWLVPKMFESPPEKTPVPNLVGMTKDEATAALTDVGLRVGSIGQEASTTVGKNKVLSQDPDADTRVDPGSSVSFVLSNGKPKTTVRSVIGLQKNQARDILEGQGFTVVLEEKESDVKTGQVIETDPAAGTSVAEGSTVTVYYSDGPEKVPNVVGKQEDAARQILENAGFTVKVFYDNAPTDKETGTVLEQTPEAGTTQSSGTQIVLIVTSYVVPTESPSPSDTTSPSPTGSPSPTP
jgi:serine/threonine-protein kinase